MAHSHARAIAGDRIWSNQDGHYYEIPCICGELVWAGPEASALIARALASDFWDHHVGTQPGSVGRSLGPH